MRKIFYRFYQPIIHKLNLIINKLDNSIEINKQLEIIKVNQALHLSVINMTVNKENILEDINKSEFKIFSQWGDDGIINFLINYLDIENKSFVEFGVEDYTECNTKLILHTHNWRGLIMDGSKKNMDMLKNTEMYWKYNITVLDKFITAENINDILVETKFIGELGLFHIDIDGNDYWIWKALKVVKPVIVIVEYNSLFGDTRAITTPYKADFFRTEAHYSNLYYGTSLSAICDLADEKGYSFIGCNTNGNNAYFIRKDKIKDLKPKTASQGYVKSQFSEARDENGKLLYLRDQKRLEIIEGQKVFNVRTNEIEAL